MNCAGFNNIIEPNDIKFNNVLNFIIGKFLFFYFKRMKNNVEHTT